MLIIILIRVDNSMAVAYLINMGAQGQGPAMPWHYKFGIDVVTGTFNGSLLHASLAAKMLRQTSCRGIQ